MRTYYCEPSLNIFCLMNKPPKLGLLAMVLATEFICMTPKL